MLYTSSSSGIRLRLVTCAAICIHCRSSICALAEYLVAITVMNALSSCAEVLTSTVLCLIKARGCTCYAASIQSVCVFVLLRLQHATPYLACAISPCYIAPCCIAPCCIAVFHAIIIYSCSCYLKVS